LVALGSGWATSRPRAGTLAAPTTAGAAKTMSAVSRPAESDAGSSRSIEAVDRAFASDFRAWNAAAGTGS
jgi:hypothetical protein